MTGTLIGLVGASGAGKTSIAKVLAEFHGFEPLRFSDPIKDMLQCLGVSVDQMNHQQKDIGHVLLCGKSPRHALQTLGTEWGRNLIGPEVWIRNWEKRYADLSNPRRVVVDDVRFQSEASLIKAYGGKLIRVCRKVAENGSHVSDVELHSIRTDFSIRNNRPISETTEYILELISG